MRLTIPPFGGVNAVVCVALIASCGQASDTGFVEGPQCLDRPLALPTARGELEGVWSTTHQTFAFFGGDQGVPQSCYPQSDFVADLWLYEDDCGNFRRVEATGPAPTGRYALAMDEVSSRMFLFGGRFREGETGLYTLRDEGWSWSFETELWQPLAPGPTQRAILAGAIAQGHYVVFGGTGSTDGGSYEPVYDEVWSYDLADEAWELLTMSGGGPGGRVFHTMTSDGETIYVFGGGDQNAFLGPFYNDLWALDFRSKTWTLLNDGSDDSAPRARIWADLLHDETQNQLVLWAGHDDGALGNTNEVYRFDLENHTWKRARKGDTVDAGANGFCDFPADFVTPDLDSPERRYGAASAMTDDGRLLTFGGKTDCGIINDLWSYDVEQDEWSLYLRATQGEICLRAYRECSSLCY